MGGELTYIKVMELEQGMHQYTVVLIMKDALRTASAIKARLLV
jgi:hypothetical protein